MAGGAEDAVEGDRDLSDPRNLANEVALAMVHYTEAEPAGTATPSSGGANGAVRP